MVGCIAVSSSSKANESVAFVLSYGLSYQKAPQAIDAQEALKATLAAWETSRDTQDADLSTDRWHCCRPDNVPAGDTRRTSQLGLPVLLAARRHLHIARIHELGFLAGGRRLASVAATGCGGRPSAGLDHVRSVG